MWISKKEYDKKLNFFYNAIGVQADKIKKLEERADNISERIWKLENPLKFTSFQEVMDGVIVADFRIFTYSCSGHVSRRYWEYHIINKNEKESYWIPQHELEEKINQSNKKQTIKTKKK